MINVPVSSKIYDNLDALPLDQWKFVLEHGNRHVFMDSRFLRAIEKSMSDQAQLWYVLFFSDGRNDPIACACISALRVDAIALSNSPMRWMVGHIRRLAPRFLQSKILLCGLPVSIGMSGLVLVPGADMAGILSELDHEMTGLAKRLNASLIVFKEHDAAEVETMQGLLSNGYLQAESPNMYYFDEPFRDLEHYLENLTSHYRYDIKRSRRKLSKNGLELTRLSDPSAIRAVYTQKVHQLYLDVVSHAKFKLEVLPCDFFHELVSQFPNEASLLMLVKNDEVLAFNWSLKTPLGYHFLFCGINYGMNKQMDLYFNLMFAELDNGLKHGAGRIALGQTSDHFKTRMGCRYQPLYFFVRGASRMTTQLLKLVFPMIFPKRSAVPAANIYHSSYHRR